MTEFDENDQDLDGTDDGDTSASKAENIKELRYNAKQAGKLRKENENLSGELQTLKRELAFTRAGLGELSPTKQAALLAAHGDNELTKDALLATAVDLGFAAPPEDSAEQQVREQALATQERITAATTGARPPAGVPGLEQQIFQAQQAGDANLVMRLKAQAAILNMQKQGYAQIT